MLDSSSLTAHRSLLAKLIAIAIALRVLWAIFVPIGPVSDAGAYDAFARTLAEHGVFGFTREEPLAFWPPGTSMIYAAAYWLFGTSTAVVVATNIIMAVALLVVSARVCSRLYDGQVAMVTVAILVFWPTLVMYTTITASEIPYLLFSMVALDAWTSPGRPTLARAAVAGVAIGIATLVRPSALLLPALYAGCQLFRGDWSRTEILDQIKAVALTSLVAAFLIAPWTIRNYQLLGAFVPVSTNGGVTLWMGNYPGSDGSFSELPDDVLSLPEHERAKVLGDRAKAYIVEDPLAFVVRGGKKLLLLFGNESVGVGWNAGIAEKFGQTTHDVLKRFTQLSWAFIFVVALLGGLYHIKRFGLWGTLCAPMIVFIAFHSAMHAVVVAQERYHIGFATPIAVLSAIGLMKVWDEFRRRSSTRRAGADIGNTAASRSQAQ